MGGSAGFGGLNWLLYVLFPIAGGILAASGFIVKKKPNAQQLIDKLTPYSASIGVAMLVAGIWNLIRSFTGVITISIIFKFAPFLAVCMLLSIFSAITVGFILGFGLIAKWIPGEGAAEQKGVELQKKLMGINVPLGFISILSGVLMALWALEILKP